MFKREEEEKEARGEIGRCRGGEEEERERGEWGGTIKRDVADSSG